MFALIVAICCELGARFDDWFFEGVPVLANPAYEALFTIDGNGLRRGKPGARWKRVALNNLGMRGADVPESQTDDCHRWMFLGASETFGEPSHVDVEYPARVRALARQQSTCVHVLNTAYPGIAPQGLTRYYESALRQHAPDVVFVYASTHFYLAEVGPRLAKRDTDVDAKASVATERFSVDALLKKSRFLERLKDTAEVPAAIQRMRLRRWIEAASKDKPPEWAFNRVPEERIDLMVADLRELIESVRRSGAEPVLKTHAVRVTDPPRPEDHADLHGMRRYVPRAPEAVIAEFEYRAAERIRELGQELQVRVVDVARELNGKRESFIDLVHFSPNGHDEVARLIVREMLGGANSHAVQ